LLTQARKENEDLKYDNNLLYEKNVQKDEKLGLYKEEIDRLTLQIDSERGKNILLDKDCSRMRE
jgi:hypothetical protein